jgi:hypothetical protein
MLARGNGETLNAQLKRPDRAIGHRPLLRRRGSRRRDQRLLISAVKTGRRVAYATSPHGFGHSLLAEI